MPTPRTLFLSEYIDFYARPETYEALKAISFLEGNRKGELSSIIRTLVQRAIERYISELSPKKRAEYDQILSNVQVERLIYKEKRVVNTLKSKAKIENRGGI